MHLEFFGVRGSTPCASDATARYGGNTSCVSWQCDGADPILFDLGTGLRYFGATVGAEQLRAHALVTHLHWDHVQGLPFCQPLLQHGSSLSVYGPSHDGVDFGEAFDQLMRPPFFPIRPHELPGDISFVSLGEEEFEITGTRVLSRYVPHTDTTLGYRVERDGISVAYVSDHQQSDDGVSIDAAVIELCRDADVVIHDAQFTPSEYEQKSNWGHCTIDYALRVAAEANAKHLVLFHHDPSHSDEMLDELVAEAQCSARGYGLANVSAAYEGMRICLA